MTPDDSMSIATADKMARENPTDAAGAIHTLFEYVDNGGTDARDAAVSLCSIAGQAPEVLDGQTDNFEHALETADGVSARLDLAEAVTELLDHHAIPPEDAGRALTKATRIRDDEYWDDRPESELLVIQEGMEGWTEVAAMGETVPETIVKRALEIADIADLTTLIIILDLLQAAVASGSPLMERAFQGLVELAQVDDPTLTSEATIAVAELVLDGDIPDDDAARDVITSNADAVRRDKQLVDQARDEIAS